MYRPTPHKAAVMVPRTRMRSTFIFQSPSERATDASAAVFVDVDRGNANHNCEGAENGEQSNVHFPSPRALLRWRPKKGRRANAGGRFKGVRVALSAISGAAKKRTGIPLSPARQGSRTKGERLQQTRLGHAALLLLRSHTSGVVLRRPTKAQY